MFYSRACSADVGSIEAPDRVLCISGVFKLEECKAGGVARDPHALEGAVVAEHAFEVLLVGITRQVPHVDLALCVLLSVARHFCNYLSDRQQETNLAHKFETSRLISIDHRAGGKYKI